MLGSRADPTEIPTAEDHPAHLDPRTSERAPFHKRHSLLIATRICDEFEGGFGWIGDDFLRRTSHALVAEGRVWLVDPVESPGIEERVRAGGVPAGVIQLLDRHARDGRVFAERLKVPHLVLDAPQTPFEVVPVVSRRWWHEIALWWPERSVLVCADALGTTGYFLAPNERVGIHPLLRLVPPRRLAGYDTQHLLVGHGEGLHGNGAHAAVREALATSRRRLPAALARAALTALRAR